MTIKAITRASDGATMTVYACGCTLRAKAGQTAITHRCGQHRPGQKFQAVSK